MPDANRVSVFSTFNVHVRLSQIHVSCPKMVTFKVQLELSEFSVGTSKDHFIWYGALSVKQMEM